MGFTGWRFEKNAEGIGGELKHYINDRLADLTDGAEELFGGRPALLKLTEGLEGRVEIQFEDKNYSMRRSELYERLVALYNGKVNFVCADRNWIEANRPKDEDDYLTFAYNQHPAVIKLKPNGVLSVEFYERGKLQYVFTANPDLTETGFRVAENGALEPIESSLPEDARRAAALPHQGQFSGIMKAAA